MEIHPQTYIQRHSHILRCSTHPQGHNRPQTGMFPDKPPPTGICNPPTQTLPPAHSFPDRHPPTGAATLWHNSKECHSHCVLSERCPLELCSAHTAQLYMEALHPFLRPCKSTCVHTHTVTNTCRYTLRFTPGPTHTSKYMHTSGAVPTLTAPHNGLCTPIYPP